MRQPLLLALFNWLTRERVVVFPLLVRPAWGNLPNERKARAYPVARIAQMSSKGAPLRRGIRSYKQTLDLTNRNFIRRMLGISPNHFDCVSALRGWRPQTRRLPSIQFKSFDLWMSAFVIGNPIVFWCIRICFPIVFIFFLGIFRPNIHSKGIDGNIHEISLE